MVALGGFIVQTMRMQTVSYVLAQHQSSSVVVYRTGLAIQRYWVQSSTALHIPGAHQAFHPSEIDKLVPAYRLGVE